jgi:hypothetical protein
VGQCGGIGVWSLLTMVGGDRRFGYQGPADEEVTLGLLYKIMNLIPLQSSSTSTVCCQC